MDHVKSDFCCPMCNLKVKKKLCEDLPGVHTYVWACDGCKREYSSEWIRSTMEYGKPHQSCPERHTVESQPPWPWRYIRARGHVHLPCGGRVRSVTCLCRIEAYRNASISSWKATICPPAFQVKTRNL